MIRRANGELCAALERISLSAFQLIKAVELERSGIRHGNGYWCGPHPVFGQIRELRRLEERLKAAYRGEGVSDG